MTNFLVAVLITTNLVFHPCSGGVPGGKCKWCDGPIRVPEHMNRIGYDMDYVVVTQYLPVIEIPAENN